MTDRPARLVHIPADGLSADTAQTGGMHRAEALSGSRVGADALWMGTTTVDPHTSSGVHHHGRSETGIYVVSGNPIFRFRDGDDIIELATEPGSFVYVPPFAPHLEENAGDEPAVVVIARTTQEAIAEPLDEL